MERTRKGIDDIRRALNVCGAIGDSCTGCPYRQEGNCANVMMGDAATLLADIQELARMLSEGEI